MRTVRELWRQEVLGTPRRRVIGEAVATWLVGLALLALGVVGTFGPGPATPDRWPFVLTLSALCLLLLAKRERPGLALSVGVVPLVVDIALGGSIGVVIAFFDLVYCVALWGRREVLRRVEALVAVAVFASAAVPFVLLGTVREAVLGAVVTFSLLATPLWWGRSVRSQAELAAVADARAEDLRRIAELREGEVLQAERTRMAAELHDALAGNLAAIGIHAEAALSLPEAASSPSGRSLTAIREASVSASDELRAMVRLLRSGDDERTAPARLADVEGLVALARQHGHTVDLDRPDPWPALPASIDHAAHRIVQESLTNATKHAPGARVAVTIAMADEVLTVRVESTLPAVGARIARGEGLGVPGMRERAESLGGRFSAGPTGGVWVVSASLPLAPDEGSPRDRARPAGG